MSRNLGTIFLPAVPKKYNNVDTNMILMTKFFTKLSFFTGICFGCQFKNDYFVVFLVYKVH